jgi:hypothetical protein
MDKQIKSLRQLIEELRRYAERPARSDFRGFTRLFSEARRILGADDGQLVTRLKISYPEIARWMSGESAPHPLGQPIVMRGLAELAVEELPLAPVLRPNFCR